MNRRKLFFYALFFFPSFLLAQLPFVLITIPKAGSHLMIKALHFLTGTPAIWHTQFPSFWCIPPDRGFLYTHFCLTEQLEQNYRCLPELQKIIAIRDLRDVAVSMVGQIKKNNWPGMSHALREYFLSLPFDEQLLFVINYEYDVHEVASVAPNSSQVSLTKIAEQAIAYAKNPSHLVVRYEDLVGPEGGGTFEAQLQALRSIAEFIQLPYSDEDLEMIACRLYGDKEDPFGRSGFNNFRSTFSRGQIGTWREVFTEEHKAAFKQRIGFALIALGYEQDEDW